MELNPRSPMPLYQQFKMLIERKIASGEWPPETLIPTELELVSAYGISRTTVRQALDELVQEGRIQRKRGRGTHVAAPKIAQTLAQLTGFAEELALRGMEPVLTILACAMDTAGSRAADALGLSPASPVLHIRRLVSVGGAPLFVDQSYFPADLAPLLDRDQIERQPIYRLLEAGGRGPADGEQWLGAVALDEETARLLRVERSVPGLAITRITRDVLGQPIEYTQVTYRSDRYEYGIHLQRGRMGTGD
jgi:GntR family transcriptional regulator